MESRFLTVVSQQQLGIYGNTSRLTSSAECAGESPPHCMNVIGSLALVDGIHSATSVTCIESLLSKLSSNA
jgi:hypothetical protein